MPRAFRRWRWTLTLWVLLFSPQTLALLYGPLDGTVLDKTPLPGPVQRSSLYVVNAPVKFRKAQADIVLDTPSGAVIVFLEEGPKDVGVIKSQGQVVPLKMGDSSELGQEVELGSLLPGKHRLEIRGIMEERADFIVSQPNSPLILNVQSRPLALRTGETAELFVMLEDKSPPKQASVEARFSNGHKRTLVGMSENTFSLRFQAPIAKNRMDDMGVEVVASGIRYDGTPFKREAMTHFMVTSPVTKIERDIFVSESGDIEITVSPLSRIKNSLELRLDVYYAHSGKKIAWVREDFVLDEGPQQVNIQRPNIAKAADSALLRLINMNHFGIEDTRLVRLPRDFSVTKQFVMPKPQVLQLPESKRRALE